jgi:hypothetical protein
MIGTLPEVQRVRVTVQNLGRIKGAEFDLRPLTVFVGRNGTNKTWTAYSVFALAARSTALQFTTPPTTPADPTNAAAIDRLAKFVASKLPGPESKSPETTPNPPAVRIVTFTREELAQAAHPFSTRHVATATELSPVLGAPPDILGDARVTWEVPVSEIGGAGASSVRIVSIPNQQPIQLSMQFANLGVGRVVTRADGDIATRIASACEEFLRIHFRLLVPLPVERMGAVAPQNLSDGSPASVYAATFQWLQQIHASPRPQVDATLPRTFSASMFGGSLVTELIGNVPSTSLLLPDGKTKLPLRASASLVRACACLLLYQETWAGQGDMVVIDEVEMNGHPESQLAIIELVGTLVNRGVHVILTTHSPYIIDHLNNMIEASNLPADAGEAFAKKHFRLGTSAAFLTPDKVAVYGFVEQDDKSCVEVKDAMDDEHRMIVSSTFGGSSRIVANLSSEIALALEQA